MLCQPLSDDDQPSALVTSVAGPDTFILVHATTHRDMLCTYEMLKEESGQQPAGQTLPLPFKESFAVFAGSHYSQAFMLLMNDHPIFEIEVHEENKHLELHPGVFPLEGNFFIVLVAGNFQRAPFPAYVHGLRLCLQYFFRFPEVKRIIAPLYEGADREQRSDLFQQAGMRMLLEKTTPNEPDLLVILRPS